MDWSSLTVIVGAGGAYAAGVRRIARAGKALVPIGAQAAWYGGVACVALVLLGPVHQASERSFTWHMVQHVVLVFIVPPLLALGAPITVALRATAPNARGLTMVLHSTVARIAANPVVGWVLLVGVSFAVHYTPIFDEALRSGPAHVVEHFLWVSVALIYWWPIVGRDPSPVQPPYPVRLLSLFLLMPPMSFLALSIYSAVRPLYGTYARASNNPVEDQRAAAVIMWLLGNLILVVAILCEAVAWKHDEERKQHAIEAREDAAG